MYHINQYVNCLFVASQIYTTLMWIMLISMTAKGMHIRMSCAESLSARRGRGSRSVSSGTVNV